MVIISVASILMYTHERGSRNRESGEEHRKGLIPNGEGGDVTHVCPKREVKGQVLSSIAPAQCECTFRITSEDRIARRQILYISSSTNSHKEEGVIPPAPSEERT